MAATPPKVKITYCAECGYEPQTLDLVKALMWDGGTFDVSVDGTLVHSMTRDGGFPTADAIKKAIRERLGP